MKRVVHVVGFLGCGGDTTAIENVYNYIKKNKLDIQFDFITHRGCNTEYVKKVRDNGSKVFILDGDVRKIGVFKYYLAIKKILRKERYDVIHFHTSFQSCIGLIAAKNCRINKRVCHSHTTAVQRKTSYFKEKVYLPICRILIRLNATSLVGCSKIANSFLYGKNSNSTVVYNGLDIKALKKVNTEKINIIKNKINSKEYDSIIGQVGRLDEMKNPFFTIELAEKMNNKLFVFLGDGVLREQIVKHINTKKIKNVLILGRVEDVNNYMSIFDYLLLPSKYGEGLPVTLIEEQIINNNCICVANDNVSEESNLGNVLFISINDKANWIKTLEEKKETKKRIDYSEFDIENTAKKWLNIYK